MTPAPHARRLVRIAPPGREAEAHVDTQRIGAAAERMEGPAFDGFARVVCGVDGRRLGFEAVRQAARLTAAEGRVTLVGVVEMFAALSGKWGDEPARWRVEATGSRTPEEATAALADRARGSLALAESQASGPARLLMRVVEGEVYDGLLDAARDEDADLVAVGEDLGHEGRNVLLGAQVRRVNGGLAAEGPDRVEGRRLRLVPLHQQDVGPGFGER
ncbi:MAG TPA: universal stress protein, partial [Miltoncostaea sp.]|nr:universal stress protein [Miltoncostaea sp.]